jgi:lipoyl(octanoyl) transferase
MGVVPYAEAHALQERLVSARVAGSIGDVLLLLEHPPVVTLGRGGKERNLLVSREALVARGIEVADIGRGGDVTYHGPGQLVAYPIIDLKPDRCDVRRYVRDLEEVMVRVASDYGVHAQRIEGLTGAWVEDRKIGAIGVRISRWVTMHGFALNVSTRLSDFDVIIPCGIAGKSVTSLAAETGTTVAMSDVEPRAAHHLGQIFGASVELHEGRPPV